MDYEKDEDLTYLTFLNVNVTKIHVEIIIAPYYAMYWLITPVLFLYHNQLRLIK